MKNTYSTPFARAGLLTSLVTGLALSLSSVASHAGEFGVRIVDELGDPVPGASVCIGLEGNYTQFGTAFTDLDGYIPAVDVPNLPFVVTVSKTRFTGVRMHEPARGFNLVKQMTLATGTPGPRCRADSSLVGMPDAPNILVRQMGVRSEEGRTTLIPTVIGGPSEYRVGTTKDFFGANWQGFNDQIALPSELASQPSVYLQLRRMEGSKNSWLEARSDVITVDLGQASN